MHKSDIVNSNPSNGTRKLPDSGSVIATGVLSIVFVTIIGVLLAIATIIKSNPQIKEYERHPSIYDVKYYKRHKLAKNLAIAGLVLKLIGIIVLSIIFN